MADPIHQTVVSTDGTKIWAEAAGDQTLPAVIFVHGFASCSAVFERQLNDPRLLANLYLICYDLRGHGRSDQPTAPEAYTSARFAEDFAAVCEAFGVTKPYLAGWSYGALIAADICAHIGPDFLAGNILLGGVPYLSARPEVADPFVLELVPRLLSTETDIFSRACGDLVDSCFSPGFVLSDKTKWTWMGVAVAQNPAVRPLLGMRTQDETGLLSARDRLPFLIIQGSADQHIRHEKLEGLMKTHFPDVTEYHRLEGVGHACFYEKPDEVNRLILNFVQRIEAAERRVG